MCLFSYVGPNLCVAMLSLFSFWDELIMGMISRHGINRYDILFCIDYHFIGSFLKRIFFLLIFSVSIFVQCGWASEGFGQANICGPV